MVISEGHLVLQEVHRKWSGPIICRGENGLGAAESSPFQLNVMCEYDIPINHKYKGNEDNGSSLHKKV